MRCKLQVRNRSAEVCPDVDAVTGDGCESVNWSERGGRAGRLSCGVGVVSPHAWPLLLFTPSIIDDWNHFHYDYRSPNRRYSVCATVTVNLDDRGSDSDGGRFLPAVVALLCQQLAVLWRQ
ncbi:hypothetical protein J6590_018186 [Homalodisca vitripennis]|nr:hypothetical protein J6590_018186 [Homalodisca vitripennis]